MAELSQTSGVSVPTIKYYLREGLLPPGRHVKTNQSLYSRDHLTRLKLIAVLSGIARLSLAEIKLVLGELDGPGTVVDTMAAMQNALVGRSTRDVEAHEDEARAMLGEIVDERRWNVRRGSEAYEAAVRALARLHTTDLSWDRDMIAEYASHAEAMGALDVRTLSLEGSSDDLLVQMVTGTLLRRQLVDALILLAQQHTTRQMMGEPAPPPEN
ncbi:MerR family transcriptional regulator [Corynebacterium sp.]|uniref:MerR family transcriptional regulator n=1 Tax=Corynebacterium sp. TaxID=1720 RepID=UPI0026DFAB73|nr:MerR family transcriptional regulator [Corynebacterium sp.]MDO5513362.1 MerR family transcriptional regulator [Corynebacterium sp.]